MALILVARTGARIMQVLLSVENDVGGVLCRLVFGDAVAERRQVDSGEHRFALSENDRRQGEMQLVDQAGAKILTHRLDATTDLHIATIGGALRLVHRRLDALGHEDEGGATFHDDGIAWMVRQHEGRRVIGRIRTPPAPPALVRPRTADRSEHIAAKDERAEPVHRTVCISFIDAVRTAALTSHRPEGARVEEPLVQFQPTLAERIFKTLLRPCSETIERDRKACNAHSRHIASTDCNSRSGQPPLATKEFQVLASKGGERTAWSMNRRKQKARNEREVIHEEAEFHLVAAPARRTVKGESQEQDIGSSEKRCLREERAGPQGNCKRALEKGGDPGKQQRQRKPGRGDVAGGLPDSEKLKGRRHGENAAKD